MDPKKNTHRPSHQIEQLNQLPTAAIFTNDGFIGSYLSQKLLELPLELIFLSNQELEEIKHLEANERFTKKIIKNEEGLSQQTLPKLDYIFQILDISDYLSEDNQEKHLTKKLLDIAVSNSAKFQLTITASSDKDLQTAINSYQTHGKAQNSLESLIVSSSRKLNLDARIVWVINAYGPKMPLKKPWVLAKLLTALHNSKQLLIEGEGLDYSHPVFITDIASALAKAMFTEGLKGEKLLVAGEKEITAINLAYKLREMILHETGELVEILFVKGKAKERSVSERMLVKSKLLNSQQNLSWKPTVDLKEGLKKTLSWLNHQPKLTPLATVVEPQPKAETKKIKPKIEPKKPRKVFKAKKAVIASIICLIIVLFIPPIVFLSTTGSAALALQKASVNLKKAQVESAIKKSQNATSLFKAARYELSLLSKTIPIEYRETVSNTEEYLEVGQLLAQSLQHAAKALNHGIKVKDMMFSESNQQAGLPLVQLSLELDSLYTKLSHIELLLRQVDLNKLSFLTQKYDSVQASQEIFNLRSSISKANEVLNLVPELLAAEGKRTYLVLFQNNAELRPTGGFIGSYALVTFENGKLFNFSVEDVYTADGQLKGFVKPPPEIEKYLGEAGWYLRDANWDPDFPTAARQIEWFFEKETGKRVDGTIAINLYVIQQILQALGPMELPDYEATITADNLFETAEYYSEINFFPGSTQKRDFLASLAKNMFLKAEQATVPEFVKFASALNTSLERGQLLIALHDNKVQKTFNDLGWDGSIRKVSCPTDTEPCAKTFIALSEANLGVNKANYFIKREISVAQDISKQETQTTLTINYKNFSPTNRWPGGDYENYLRVYLEEGSQVSEVLVNNKKLESSEISFKAEHGKQAVGFLVVVPINEETEVTLVINSEAIEFEAGKSKLSLLIQKQSGTENDRLTVTITFPEDIIITKTNLPLKTEARKASLSQNFTEDLDLQVELETGE